MKKSIFSLLGGCILVFGSVSLARAADWSKYDTGHANIRVDGYAGQPGYVAFKNGLGTITGYLFMSENSKLYFVTSTDLNLTTTQLGSQGGESKVSQQ